MINARYEIYTSEDYYSNGELRDNLVFITNDELEMLTEYRNLCEKAKQKIKNTGLLARYNVHVIENGKPFSFTIKNKDIFSKAYWDSNSLWCNRLGQQVLCHGRCRECKPRKDANIYEE